MKLVRDWDEEDVLGLPLGEFDWFEAKGRKALDLTLPQVQEHHVRQTLSVAISAFANTGGGQLIYGLKNPQPSDIRWIVDDGGVSTSIKGNTREWLEAVIPNSVDSHLASFNVYQTPPAGSASQLEAGHALYVIDIPDSTHAPHQAFDNKYYIRVAGRSRPAGHRLILDILGRRKHPRIELGFEVEVVTEQYHSGWSHHEPKDVTECTLKVEARNTGQVYAQYVNGFIQVPASFFSQEKLKYDQNYEQIERNGQLYYEFYRENTVRDVVDVASSGPVAIPKYGPSRFDPILPGLCHTWHIELGDTFPRVELEGLVIRWSVHADNAAPNEGETKAEGIRILDSRNT